ncbi:MAG: hypothetical protein JXA33_05075 [Anaerolineae bacterium]|nr:hypothetical protein [Anaerolineae bacterium]
MENLLLVDLFGWVACTILGIAFIVISGAMVITVRGSSFGNSVAYYAYRMGCFTILFSWLIGVRQMKAKGVFQSDSWLVYFLIIQFEVLIIVLSSLIVRKWVKRYAPDINFPFMKRSEKEEIK